MPDPDYGLWCTVKVMGQTCLSPTEYSPLLWRGVGGEVGSKHIFPDPEYLPVTEIVRSCKKFSGVQPPFIKGG
jgi:hypothetical protein